MTSVLNRMIQRQRADTPDVPLTASRAVKLSTTRAAQASIGLIIDVRDVSETTTDLDGVTTDLSDDLLMLTLIRQGKIVGVLTCDATLIAAGLETITTGKISSSPAPPRAITATDAAMLRPLLNSLLDDLATTTVGTSLDGWTMDCKLGDRLDDVRAATFALTEENYRVIVITVSDQKTDRQPKIMIALPNLETSVKKAATAKPDTGDWTASLRQSVNTAPAKLSVVAHRMSVPVSRLTTLAVGDCLPLVGFSIGAVRIEAPGGALVANGRLGQIGGRIAVKIQSDTPHEMTELPHKLLTEPVLAPTAKEVTMIA